MKSAGHSKDSDSSEVREPLDSDVNFVIVGIFIVLWLLLCCDCCAVIIVVVIIVVL